MINNLNCHFSIKGKGPVVFLIHGIGASEDAWRFMIPELLEHFTVITYDLRGHGKSPVTHKNFTFNELVLDLERIRKRLKIKQAHFIGHSLGGMIAPAYALKFPQHILSVVLLSTVAGRSLDDRNKILSVISDMKKKGITKILSTLVNRWFTDEFIKNYPSLVDKRLKQVINTDPEVFLNVFKIYATTEIFPLLKYINKPCLLITGENDLGCTPVHNKKMSKEIKNSQLIILPKIKHSILLEQPNQIVSNILKFIKK